MVKQKYSTLAFFSSKLCFARNPLQLDERRIWKALQVCSQKRIEMTDYDYLCNILDSFWFLCGRCWSFIRNYGKNIWITWKEWRKIELATRQANKWTWPFPRFQRHRISSAIHNFLVCLKSQFSNNNENQHNFPYCTVRNFGVKLIFELSLAVVSIIFDFSIS
jgi:hypothetical protein